MKANCKLIIATHNIQQVECASDFTAFMLDGRLIDYNEDLHRTC